MLSITTILLCALLARISSGASMSSSPEVGNPHTRQVQQVLASINRLVHQQILDHDAGRYMNEVHGTATPSVKGDQEVASKRGDEARGARQTGEMIGSLLGSGLDEVLTNIGPLITEVLGPFMTTIGVTLLEWFSYTDHKTKTATQESDSKTNQQIIFDAFEVDFPEYGKFLVLGKRKLDDASEDQRKVDDAVEDEGEAQRQRLMTRNLEQFDSRFQWIEKPYIDRRFQRK